MINKSTKKQNYFAGIFVILGVVLMVLVYTWFSFKNHKSYNQYETIFHEPVDGISTDSNIKYNGVEVGKVTKIELDKLDPNSIHVYLNIIDSLPITNATYSKINSQGITGLSYIELRSEKKSKPPKILVADENGNIPPIPSHPSLLFILSEQSQGITDSTLILINQFKKLLSDENINNIGNEIRSLHKITTNIEKQSEKIDRILDNVQNGTANIGTTFESIQKLTLSIDVVSNNLSMVLQSVNDNTLNNLNSIVVPNLNQAITNLNKTSLNFNHLIKSINDNPTSLVRNIEVNDLGPGEK